VVMETAPRRQFAGWYVAISTPVVAVLLPLQLGNSIVDDELRDDLLELRGAGSGHSPPSRSLASSARGRSPSSRSTTTSASTTGQPSGPGTPSSLARERGGNRALEAPAPGDHDPQRQPGRPRPHAARPPRDPPAPRDDRPARRRTARRWLDLVTFRVVASHSAARRSRIPRET
jgi:hypothetical protein